MRRDLELKRAMQEASFLQMNFLMAQIAGTELGILIYANKILVLEVP